jgi:hypothetical protein
MTTFSYTTGNPSNLTAGATASMNDIQGPFTDLRTFLNGANLDTSNLATSAKPATLLAPPQTVAEGFMFLNGLSIATTYFPNSNGTPIAITGTSTSPLQLRYINVSDYAVSGLTPQMRLVVAWGANGTAAGVNFTFQLYDVTAFSSVANGMGVQTVAGVGGSSTTITAPGAGSRGSAITADFSLPSSVSCAVSVAPSGSMAASSFLSINWRLEVHWV